MIRHAFQRLMYGRYGNDQLNLALAALYLTLFFLYTVCGWPACYWLSMAVLVAVCFRMFSRNPIRRREENAVFLRLIGPAVRWIRFRRAVRRDKEHRYFRCPSCGQQLRVPRGKGRITVSCRGCGANFEEKS